MKTTFFSIVLLVVGLASSAKSSSENYSATAAIEATIHQRAFSTNELVKGYLNIKNALVKSNSKAASQSAEVLVAALNSVTVSSVPVAQKQAWITIAETAKKQVNSIVITMGNLDKQRKTFRQLSVTMNELVRSFGTSQKLYHYFCPMYEGGSIWFSETKDIKNPYYGAPMLTCGRMQETEE